MKRIGFIGSGNMAEALIKGVIEAGFCQAGNVYVSDIRPERLKELVDRYNVSAVSQNSELAGMVDIIVLSVKPQNMAEALASIRGTLRKNSLVISIAAGIKTSDIAAVLGDIAIIRVMPNTPALIGAGASALFANQQAGPMLDEAMAIFRAVGMAVVVESEDLIDAVTAVSGSGPAYYFLLIEEMLKAACQLGLDEKTAKNLVLQTAKGAALLAVEADKKGESPAELRRKVTSPGGTTEAALKIFEQGNFGPLVLSAIKSVQQRSRELSG